MTLKLLDYGKPNPFAKTLGKPRNLAWPVNAYRVTLPGARAKSAHLNPFELLMLNLIDAGGPQDAHTLSQETCIPEDLVQCVLMRLCDRRYIDEHNCIRDEERDSWNDKTEKHQEYTTALLFRDSFSGKIFPYLHVLDSANPLRKQDADPEKRHKTIRANHKYLNDPPTPRDVVRTSRAMMKRRFAFGKKSYLPKIQQVTIARDAEQYHLDCPIAIQKSDGEFRIADPFGNGYSLLLESSLRQALENNENLSAWLLNWRKDLSNPARQRTETTTKESYDNETNWDCYPKLLKSLRPKKGKQYRTIGQIYAALEWAFFYSCCERSYNKVIRRLELEKQEDHHKRLHDAAKKIGFNQIRSDFLPVSSGKLKAFLNGNAELDTVLCIALLIAERDPSHPLRDLAEIDPDFLVKLFEFKRKRDSQGHGTKWSPSNDKRLPEESFMQNTVSNLLRSMVFSDTSPQAMSDDEAADIRLDARTSIQQEFGFAGFNRLGVNLQERLIDAERFWIECIDNDDASNFAFDLSAAMQQMFRDRPSRQLPPDLNKDDYHGFANKKAIDNGLGHLPDQLRSVNPYRIQETLQGNDRTLGACAVAFLLISDEDTLAIVADAQPSFLDDINLILKSREHGNRSLPLPKDEIRKLRHSCFTTIKTLLEV
jgi:hypothetical protein